MTPGTRLLEAARAWLDGAPPDTIPNAEERALEVATRDLGDARALYPAAHAIGDQVLAEENNGSPAGLATVIAIRFTVEKVNYKLRFEDTLQKVWFDAAYVHPAPRTLPLYRAPGVSGGPDWTVEEIALNPQPAPSWFPMDGRRVSPRVAAQMHDMAVATGRVPAEAPTDVSAIPKRTGAPKNEYVCLLLGGNPLTRCVLVSGHGGACVAEKDRWVPREQLPYPSPGEPFDYDSLTDDERALLRKTPRSELDSHADPGWVSVGPGREITRTNTLLIPGRVQITRHTDEHGVKTTETVDLRDPDDLHARFAEALGQEWRKLEGDKDVRHEWLAAFERAAEIAGEVWVRR